MSDCTHDCSNCSEKDCGSRIEKEKQNEHSNIKKMYAVVSGKGGVGKSMVTSMLSVATARRGFKVGVYQIDDSNWYDMGQMDSMDRMEKALKYEASYNYSRI